MAPGEWRKLHDEQVPTEADEGPDAVIQRLADVAREAAGRWPGIATVGIGVPGAYDPAAGTVLELTNFPGDWAGAPVASVVGAAVGLPTHVINDARAFGLAELRLGAGRGASSIVGLTLGTGVGGVVVIDGRVHQGHDGSAGEIGHQTLDPDGPECNCGNRGCLEAFCRADRIAEACGAADAEEAFARARAGDPVAVAGVRSVGQRLGIGIANVVTILTPDRVVIGGGVSASLDMLIDEIWAELHRRVHLTSLDRVEIVRAELGVWAGAIGAAIHGAEAAAAAAPAD